MGGNSSALAAALGGLEALKNATAKLGEEDQNTKLFILSQMWIRGKQASQI